VLHSQPKWKDRVQLERNFTMNGNWMDYVGKWLPGQNHMAQVGEWRGHTARQRRHTPFSRPFHA
jgi:hypothetical protein